MKLLKLPLRLIFFVAVFRICGPSQSTGKPCSKDEDCGDTEKCIKGACKNACEFVKCSIKNSECFASNHNYICRCVSGYGYNVNNECIYIGTPCSTNDMCKEKEECLNRACQDPCNTSICQDKNSYCVVVNHVPKCKCKKGFKADKDRGCIKKEKGEGYCDSDADCPSNAHCYKHTCMRPCSVFDCGDKNWECKTENHKSGCVTKPGFEGRCRLTKPPTSDKWYVFRGNATWYEALAICAKIKMVFGIIENEREFNEVIKVWEKVPNLPTLQRTVPHGMWIGAQWLNNQLVWAASAGAGAEGPQFTPSWFQPEDHKRITGCVSISYPTDDNPPKYFYILEISCNYQSPYMLCKKS